MSNFDDLLNNGSPEEQQQQDGRPFSKEEYAAKKRKEREVIYTLADNTAMEIVADGGRFQQYLDVQAQFSRYSAVNALVILAQNSEATMIGNFEYWKNQGGYVMQGQSGISILEPGKEYEREDGSIGISYNIKKVFDISQVDTRKLKMAPAHNYTEKFTERQLLQALISKAPVKITGVTELPDYLTADANSDVRGENGSVADPETGEVFILKGMEFSDTFSAVALELAYIEAASNASNAKEALDPNFTAYSAAYILCKKYGVSTKGFNFENAPGAFGLISESDPQAIKNELSKIRDTADVISARMEKQLDVLSKSAKIQEER